MVRFSALMKSEVFVGFFFVWVGREGGGGVSRLGGGREVAHPPTYLHCPGTELN